VATIEVEVRHLPEMIQRVAEIVGPVKALVFCREFGGTVLYLPHLRYHPTHPVAMLLGVEAAHELSRSLGGGHLMVPSARTYLNYLDVRALRVAGLTSHEIGKRVRLHRRSIYRLLSGFDPSAYEANDLVAEIAGFYRAGVAQVIPTKKAAFTPAPALPPIRPQLDFGFPPAAERFKAG
jgi:hypothetical protein